MKDIINSKPTFASLIVCFTLMVASVQAAGLVQFSNGNIADADDVNANFNELKTRIETITLTPGPAGADSTVAGPQGAAGGVGAAGPAGLGAVVFSSAPKVNDDMNNLYSVGTVWVDTSTNRLYILEDNTANEAVWTIAAAPAVKYALGDIGPAGGLVFYVTDDGLHGLEAAPEDIGGNDDAITIVWGCSGTLLVGMNETGVGSGAHNTSQRDLCDDPTTAAKSAAAFEHNGYFDWFLPSKEELNLMYVNLADPDGNNYNSGRSDPDNLGGFAGGFYWSSTQGAEGNLAWLHSFVSGTVSSYHVKQYPYYVRAARAF
jgi:hypothetical protein